ncbi:MAG: hypothetical protein HFF89_06035 [Oscillibacter sp.]|jgi:hypothetical protein|nr:hypothetical protein [Oscillibacter sp.]MCI8689177.1 hypothetical protein [Oscillibacter sp.]MCI8849179.1 hypothetical protein [Oscillibacter sp.]MCI9376798.1 hypothetical protein [Oscillibacter sp.]MCI9480992.1 hypothetical protein [Oscillibacter sp.]
MAKLIAQRPVLYQGRSYRRGDALPLDNAAMADAWLRAGSAKREEEAGPEVQEAEKKRGKR